MASTDDSDGLIRRWQRGDPAGFAGLVARWQQPMARFLARLVGPAQAPDLTQEVFVKLYRSARHYRHDGHFQAWLYRLGLNVARDHHRRVAARPALQPWNGQERPDDESAAAAQVLVRTELCTAVQHALNVLPLPQREALVLRHYEGQSFEAMARLLGTPATTLKSRFAAALLRVKDELTRQGWGAEDLT
jgi:RNA polymerase sigma-70 factor (ECF subfamily)